MKITLDETLPARLAPILRPLGHDEQLVGRPDEEIWEAAQKESRFLITQDLDFSDTRRFAPGSHKGILLIRLDAPSRQNLLERIHELFQTENAVEWVGCFVVATERKIRIQRPESSQNS